MNKSDMLRPIEAAAEQLAREAATLTEAAAILRRDGGRVSRGRALVAQKAKDSASVRLARRRTNVARRFRFSTAFDQTGASSIDQSRI